MYYNYIYFVFSTKEVHVTIEGVVALNSVYQKIAHKNLCGRRGQWLHVTIATNCKYLVIDLRPTSSYIGGIPA